MIYPGLHIIETNIGVHYATSNKLPDASMLPRLMEEANTTYFNVDIIGNTLKIVVDSPASTSPLMRMHGMPMYLVPEMDGIKISKWILSGTLADHLGIQSSLN